MPTEFYVCAYQTCAEETSWPASCLWWWDGDEKWGPGFYCPECIRQEIEFEWELLGIDKKVPKGPNLEEIILLRDKRLNRWGCIFNKINESFVEDWKIHIQGELKGFIRVYDIKEEDKTAIIRAWKYKTTKNHHGYLQENELEVYRDNIHITGDRYFFSIASHEERIKHFDKIADTLTHNRRPWFYGKQTV